MLENLSSGKLFPSAHRTISILTILSLIIILFISSALAHNHSRIVFGPKQYTRTTGKPDLFKDTFQAQQGKGKIFIKNGDKLFHPHFSDKHKNNKVDSATISLNGKKIFGPHDFNHHRNFLIANVNLKNGQNTVEVELKSKPESHLTIEIIQTGLQPRPKPTVTISANPASITSGAETTLTWTSTDADTCKIDNGIGEVSLNGSLSVSPTQTTTYTITATAPGGTATATAVVDVKTIDITITSPLDGGSLTGTSTIVTGTINNYNGTETGVTVNGIPATLSNNQFAVNNVPLTAGQNTITATATDTNGATATKSITVNATPAANYLKISAYPDSGTSPLEVTLRINGSFSINNPVITFTGPAGIEQLTGANPDEYRYKITTEGIYYFTVQAIGPDNNTYQDTMAVTVLSLAQVDALLREKWAIFTSALTNKDTVAALNAMYPASRERYQMMFNLLKDQLPAIVSTHAGLVLQSIIENVARYELETIENGVAFTYRVSFIKDMNGLWVIREF
jgi:hypothetical protein